MTETGTKAEPLEASTNAGEQALSASERARRRHLRLLAVMAAMTVIITALIAGTGAFTGQPMPLTLLAAAVALTIGAVAVAITAQRYRIDPRPALFRQYCAERTDLLYAVEPDEAFDMAPFIALDLVPRHTTADLNHHIIGRHRGIAFEIVCAHLDRRRRSMERYVLQPVFEGVLIAIDAHDQPSSDGPILIGRARGRAARAGRGWRRACRQLSRIDWATGDFGKAYHCHAADQEAARRLLDGPIAACLSALADAAPRSPIKAALSDGMFLMALPLPHWIRRRPSAFRPCRRLSADVQRLDGVVALARAAAAGLSRPVRTPAQ